MASPEEYKLVDQSGYFDRDYYLARYPDVRAAGVDPVEHYLNHGGMERRDPHPKFHTAFYLEQCARLEKLRKTLSSTISNLAPRKA